MAIQLPIGAEDKFIGVIDLVKMKAITYKDETMGADYVVSEIPAEMMAEAKDYREKLIEKVSEPTTSSSRSTSAARRSPRTRSRRRCASA